MVLKLETRQTVETKQRFRLAITGENLRNLLAAAGHQIPKNARIIFTVPGGGDWSNMAIDIDGENPVEVQWETVTIAENGS